MWFRFVKNKRVLKIAQLGQKEVKNSKTKFPIVNVSIMQVLTHSTKVLYRLGGP
jgi:hypothetical protein